MSSLRITVACAVLVVWSLATPVCADVIDEHLAAIAAVSTQGAGSAAARSACDALAEGPPELIPRLLSAMQTDNPVAANWYRSAFERIVERQLKSDSPQLPLDELKSVVRDDQRAGRLRRMAMSLCDRQDPQFSKGLMPTLLNDPEFRNDAVELTLVAGQRALEEGDSETARDRFQQAFEHARDATQSVRAADKLAGLGQRVDVAEHLGLVIDWWVVGPFDSPGFSGFAHEFPPERGIDLKARFTGQNGTELTWVRHRCADPLGLVNLTQALSGAKEAVGYAYSAFEVSTARPAQLRCGADDNCTVWLNGDKVFSREQWLNGIRLDRFVVPVQLRAGTNKLLVKVCQGPQHKDPQVGNAWSLQLRLCDETGAGVPFRSALPEIAGGGK